MEKDTGIAGCPSCGECCDNYPLTLEVSFFPSGTCLLFGGPAVLERSGPRVAYWSVDADPGNLHARISCSEAEPGYDFYCQIGADGCEGGAALEVVSCNPLRLTGTFGLSPIGEEANCCGGQTITVVAVEGVSESP